MGGSRHGSSGHSGPRQRCPRSPATGRLLTRGRPAVMRRSAAPGLNEVRLVCSPESSCSRLVRGQPDSAPLSHTGDVQRVGRGAIVVGAVVLCGFVASVLTIYVIVLTGQSHGLMTACSSSVSTSSSGVTRSSPQVCSPLSLWAWAIPVVGIVGAAAGGIGTSLLMRHRIRPLDRAAPPLAPTIFR